ncbi:MAG: HAMP domain-containing protein, partial [Thermoleophilaceae bacterium]
MVVPMIAVALVLFSLTADSEHGKVDARLATGLRTGLAFYQEGRQDARRLITRVAADDGLTQALRSGDESAAEARLRELVAASPEIEAITYATPAGSIAASAGSADAVATSTVQPTTAEGERLGTLGVSVTSADEFTRQVARFTGLDARVLREDRVLATTIPGASAPEAESGDVELGEDEYRARVQVVRDGTGPPVRIHVLEDASAMSDSITETRLLIGGLLIAFLGLSLASSVFVVRALQAQIDNFLQAARQLGSGDLTERVPVEGDDEFAALGQEFNTMAEQLETHIEEVERKRRELEDSIRRIGEAFGTGLDRQGLVDLA